MRQRGCRHQRINQNAPSNPRYDYCNTKRTGKKFGNTSTGGSKQRGREKKKKLSQVSKMNKEQGPGDAANAVKRSREEDPS